MVASQLQFKQFSAHVKVDGEALECYSTWVNKKAKHVSCWIPSEAGKAFSVIFEKEETKRFCAAYLNLDGAEMFHEVYLRDEDQSEWDFMETSKTMGRRFKFSNLSVTEGEATVDETVAGSKVMEKVGSIEVTIYAAMRNGYNFYNDGDAAAASVAPTQEPPTVFSVPKSVTHGKILHQVSFGEEEVIKPEPPRPVANRRRGRPRRRPRKVPRYRTDKEKLLAKFTFKCRPLDTLQRAGIAPRDPTPLPPDTEPADEPGHQVVDERMDEPTGEGTDEPASGPLPSEPVNELANDRVDERVDENIIEPIDVDRQLGEIVGFVAEHDDLVDQPSPVPLLPPTADEDQLQSNKRKTPPFDVKEEEKFILQENHNSDDEDNLNEREIFLMAELEKVRNKRFVKKEGALEGSPRKRFKQEDRPAFIQGEVIDLT